MLYKLRSIASIGLETVPVDVEVDVASTGFPGFTIVGLASKAVEEARERVKTAVVNSGFQFPNKKITVNLAPADLPKDGAAYDLPIAVGVLAASGQLPFDVVYTDNCFFYGELSLDGTLRPTRGILLVGLFAQQQQHASVFVPSISAREASVVSGITVMPVDSLSQLAAHITKTAFITPIPYTPIEAEVDRPYIGFDISEISGQEQAKRALLIAAAGGHNLLMYGPPGTGKTMLARTLPSILPTLSSQEALEVTRIYSISGLLETGQAFVRERPFRAPHHGVSAAGLVGGGSNPLPGEVSLAHLGVLFLDEMPEFPRSVLEGLRQPMEDGVVEIVRAASHVRYPASFTLIAAINPCPCGYLGHPRKQCKCTVKQIAKYKHRISGPILDRIDLHVSVSCIEVEKLAVTGEKPVNALTSLAAKEQVKHVRFIQAERFKNLPIYTNSQMRNKEVKRLGRLSKEAETILALAAEKYDFSARSYFRLIKVARTIADLETSESIEPVHMAEALQYKAMS